MQQQSELPEGWANTSLEEVSYVRLGKTPKKSQYKNEGIHRIIKFKDISKNGLEYSGKKDSFIDDNPEVLKSLRKIQVGDVLLTASAHSGDNIGKKTAFVDKLPCDGDDTYFVGELLAVTSNDKIIDEKWPFHFFQSELGFEEIQKAVFGVHLTSGRAKKIQISLPPLAEQHRIVSAIEALFAHLDAANERLDRVPDIVKKFRQSVLAAACDGRLTEGWREENQNIEYPEDFFNQISEKHNNKYIAACEAAKRKGERAPKKPKNIEPTFLENEDFIDVPAKWIWMLLPDIGYMNRGTSRNRPRNDPSLFGGKYPFIQTGEIARSNGRITTHKKTYNENGLAQSKLWPKGTVCITIAANIANSGILTYPACFPDSVVGVIPDDEICNNEYLEYFVRTAKDNLSQFAPATAQKNINIAILNDVAIPLPPLPEQHEIVRRVDALFALADSIAAKVAAAQERTEKLRQSILAKAYSGELVETEAELARQEGRDYEPADVLLERIKSEQGMSWKKGKAAKGKSTHRRE